MNKSVVQLDLGIPCGANPPSSVLRIWPQMSSDTFYPKIHHGVLTAHRTPFLCSSRAPFGDRMELRCLMSSLNILDIDGYW